MQRCDPKNEYTPPAFSTPPAKRRHMASTCQVSPGPPDLPTDGACALLNQTLAGARSVTSSRYAQGFVLVLHSRRLIPL